jgi:hypothetical protein
LPNRGPLPPPQKGWRGIQAPRRPSASLLLGLTLIESLALYTPVVIFVQIKRA